MDKFLTKSFQETQKIGFDLAQSILMNTTQKTAVILALHGDLGAGKTTFLQGFSLGLGIKEVVNSPTFIIMKKFSLVGDKFSHFYHFDLYRLETTSDLDFFNLADIFSDSKNIIAIEWPEKLKGSLPKNIINIDFQHLQENQRKIIIKK